VTLDASAVGQRLDRRVYPVLAAGADRDPRAEGNRLAGHCQADARCAADDDDSLAVE
jgi:hypothetical protein